MATGHYHLDLDTQKKNVFVTQLNERDEEEDAHVFPIVKESAGKLLENGINTLQKTLLLKKEVEVEKVDRELKDKRDEFKKRMEECSKRQIDIQKNQQKMKDDVSKMEKYINENEAKRRRAIQKYQTEVKLKEQKRCEYEIICEQLDALKKRHEYLKRKLARYKMYEDYLLRVIDILPAHYLEVNDSMLNSLMMRHRTLSSTNESLVNNLQDMVEELDIQRQQFDEMNREHEKMKMSINSQLSQKQKVQEVRMDANQEKEQHFTNSKADMRGKREEFGKILMSINNIADKCRRHMDPDYEGLSYAEKLDVIKEYICDQTDVAKMAQRGGSSSPRSSKSRQRKGYSRATDSKNSMT